MCILLRIGSVALPSSRSAVGRVKEGEDQEGLENNKYVLSILVLCREIYGMRPRGQCDMGPFFACGMPLLCFSS